jgi:RNA ligase (TIGR02306 family)
MRKLATIRKIDDLQPIEGADRIELAIVDGWKVVVTKGLNIGDKIVYCEIDSFLPIKPEFEFLRKNCYKKLTDGLEGFRLKTIRLKNISSQGLILPLSILNNYGKLEEVNNEFYLTIDN